MYIPDCLVWAIGYDGCTAVKVYCEEELREAIVARFKEVFNGEYEKLLDLVEEEEGACYEKEEELNPFKGAQVTDYGVFLPFDALSLYCDIYGDHLSWHNAGEALEEALKIIKREHPSISYEGYVAYCWSDVHSGEVVQYEISSEKKKKKDKGDVIYDFVGEALGETLEDEEVWDKLSEDIEVADVNEIKKIIKLLHIYSKWVPSDAIDKVIEISEESDEDVAESLHDFADALRAGKEVDIEEEIDTSGLPDGYMEAMDMFLMAEEISGKKPKRGEIMSSAGTFEIVIEKAESGDAEAKFTAGKYFIADHIEEETERAVRWIREAAEAGVGEAEEYMEEHSEMFE